MEVRQQGIDDLKGVPGENSQRGPAVVGLDGAAFPGDVFQRPDDGSTNGENPARLVSRPGDRLCGADRDAYVFGMEDVVSWVLGHDRAERARADLQRDLRPAYIARFQFLQELFGEVQPGGRRRSAGRLPRVNRLVALGVALEVLDVRR